MHLYLKEMWAIRPVNWTKVLEIIHVIQIISNHSIDVREKMLRLLRRSASEHSLVCENSVWGFCYFGGPNFENRLSIFLEIDTKMTNEDRTQMSVPTCNTCDYTFTGQFGCEKDYIFTLYLVIFPGELGM